MHLLSRPFVAVCRHFAVGLGMVLSGLAAAQQHLPISAHTAQVALARGAQVLDVRSRDAFEQAHLPGAAWVPGAQNLGDAALAQALSQAGVDLSREVVLVGDAGCEITQALHGRLAQVASGRVAWLVGGLPEWVATGRMVSTGAALARLAVPQHLVAFQQRKSDRFGTVAAASRRMTVVKDSSLAFAAVRLH